MDVRCEKCGTEYELDEARLKPGGVTVKCTNCGHMFKIRKRAPTNVGATPPPELTRSRAPSGGVPIASSSRAPSAPVPERQRAPDSGRVLRDDGGGERLWIIRFDDGSQKQCRELSTLQQWIVSGTVTRESMISRTAKTWKRLGDIAELSSFFIVADEARQQRMGRDTGRVTAPVATQAAKEPEVVRTTQVGVASGPKQKVQAAREEVTQAAVPRSLADVGSRPKPSPSRDPLPSTTATGLPPIPTPAPRTTNAPTTAPAKLGALPSSPPGASAKATVPAVVPTVPMVAPVAAANPTVPATPAARLSTPPPVPSGNTPLPVKGAMPVAPPPATDARKTGAWANEQIRPIDSSGEWVAPDDVQLVDESGAARGPMSGKIAAIPDEPLFTSANLGAPVSRARPPADESPFAPRPPAPGAPLAIFEDDDSEPVRVARGGAGKWIALALLFVAAGAAAGIYYGVVKKSGAGTGSDTASGTGTGSGTASGTGTGSVAAAVVDAQIAAPPPAPPDAAPATPPANDPIAAARDALLADVVARMDDPQRALAADETRPGALALEARLIAARAQSLEDQATLEPDKKIAAALHKQAQQRLIDAVHYAQRAQKAQPADVTAAVAMADILRLQGKPARDVQRYLASGLAAKDRDARLVAALVELRDGKREPARADLEKIDSGDDALERSGDVRARFRRAMIAYAAGDGATAKQLAGDVLGTQPDHEGARKLLGRVSDKVAVGDPLPPEDHPDAGVGAGTGSGPGTGTGPGTGSGPGTGASPIGEVGYAPALAKANQLAEDGDCGHAMEYYQKALSAKPTSVEALTGEGYCYLDTKQFSSAFSAFRSALAINSSYERALWGIAEGYQQQGLTQKAIDAYQKYLEVYPDSAAAKKQIEHLGGGGDSGSGSSGGSASGGSGSASSAPPPPDNGGSGSGSSAPPAGSGSASGNDPFGNGSGSASGN